MSKLHQIGSFLRWRVKPKRWLVKGLHWILYFGSRTIEGIDAKVPQSALADELRQNGYLSLGRIIDPPKIDTSKYKGFAKGKAFVDLSCYYSEDVVCLANEVICKPEIASLVLNYFDGRPWLWNVALNYSEPSNLLLDSQLWHFDYSDTKQLHILVYLTDVGSESGPFTFLPLDISSQIKRHPFFIERKTDSQMLSEFGVNVRESRVQLTGSLGEVFVNDPGFLMHQGARCQTERLVLFITFTSPAPMSRGGRATINAERRAEFGRAYASSTAGNTLPSDTFR